MFDFDITPETITSKKTTRKVAKKTNSISSTDDIVTTSSFTVLDDLIEANEKIIEKRMEDIHTLQVEIAALKSKTDMTTLLTIRRGLSKATILRKTNEEKTEKLIARLNEFDKILNISKSDLDQHDLYYFK